MNQNDFLFKKRHRRRGWLTAVWAAVLVCSLVGCQADVDTGQADTEQTVQGTQQTAETTTSQIKRSIKDVEMLKTETLADTAIPYITKIKDSKNIFFDTENGTMYYFFKDGETVDLSVIEDIAGITSINISPLEDNYTFRKIIGFDESQNTDNITSLSISGGMLDGLSLSDSLVNIDDLSFLNLLGNITELYFSSCSINAVSSECTLKNVKSLNLKNCHVKDFSFIKNSDLTYIKIISSTINNTSVLDKMYNLSYIIVADTTIDNIDFLSNMNNLTNIYFINTPVKKIPYLNLTPNNTNYVEDYRHIYFQNCGEIDISGLSGLKNSEEMLFKIVLKESLIKDFSPLAELPHINELDLSNTDSSDYNTLKGVSSNTIWLDNCNLSDIDFLSNSKVGTISLSNNNIYDWSPLLDVEGLVWCWTFDNPVVIPDNIEKFEEKEIFLADSNKWAYPY